MQWSPALRSQAPSPIGNGGVGTVSRDLIGYIGLGPVPARLAPYDQPDLRAERLAQCHPHAPYDRAHSSAKLLKPNSKLLPTTAIPLGE
jgi:hypothetical protein